MTPEKSVVSGESQSLAQRSAQFIEGKIEQFFADRYAPKELYVAQSRLLLRTNTTSLVMAAQASGVYPDINPQSVRLEERNVRKRTFLFNEPALLTINWHPFIRTEGLPKLSSRFHLPQHKLEEVIKTKKIPATVPRDHFQPIWGTPHAQCLNRDETELLKIGIRELFGAPLSHKTLSEVQRYIRTKYDKRLVVRDLLGQLSLEEERHYDPEIGGDNAYLSEEDVLTVLATVIKRARRDTKASP